MRASLFVLALAAVLMSGPIIIHLWPRLTWPLRTLMAGATVLLIYILVGQVKAFALEIPFDAFSWVGFIGMTIFDTGLVWVLTQRQHDLG